MIQTYCLDIFSFSIFQFSFYNLHPVFLDIQGSVESVADYRILNGIINIVTMLGGTFIGILLPSTSKVVANHDKNAYYRIAYDGTKYISILICFCCFGMMSIGTEVLTLYVGESYLYLIPWLNLWLLCTLGTHNQAISSLILASNDIRAISYSTAAASIIGLLTAWFFIPYYGIGGVCIAFAIYTLIHLLFYYIYYWPYKMGINSLNVLKNCFIPYVILGISLYYIVNHIPISLPTICKFFVKGVIFSILYLSILWLIMNKDDKAFIKRIVNRK